MSVHSCETVFAMQNLVLRMYDLHAFYLSCLHMCLHLILHVLHGVLYSFQVRIFIDTSYQV